MAIPSPTTFESVSRRRFLSLVSAKRRLPVPRTTGKIIMRSSSMRSCSRSVCKGRGDDVLGHGVKLIRELALHRRPCRGEAIVGHTSQQQRLGVQGLVELEPVALLSAIDLEGPSGVLEVLASARRLDDAVQRDVLGRDYLPISILLR